ncbi:MAG: HAMP domain-containing histidine kinase [Rhodospirillales bacterium]|nr:HAMP domain-containing histidine kinase [Rhodospirillales bacterium]
MTAAKPHRPPVLSSLSARLLVLTIFFVMIAEFLIYAPSISRYRKVYLEQSVATAHLAALALEATPDNMVSKELEQELLFHANAYGIVLKHPERKMLMLSKDMPPKVDVEIDLQKVGSFVNWISDAFEVLLHDENRVLRVIGVSPKNSQVTVEVIQDEKPLHQAMAAYSARILQLSLVISFITAGLVFLSLHLFLVRPMGRITRAIIAFRENPEAPAASVSDNQRSDEIGIAERELAVMQDELRTALDQKTRLATLGAAVAKINHDLRNSLATAVLASDKLADIDDPEVRKVTPRLYRAIDRAVHLCSQTLNFVGDVRAHLRPERFHLSELVDEVGSVVQTTGEGGRKIEWENKVDFKISVTADREQLFRALDNLAQNARQAGAKTVTIHATEDGGRIRIDIADDGSGLTERARERLFEPFSGSTREGGTGLGLVIARDILRAHGGDISLLSSGAVGTVFRLELNAESGA